MIKYYFKSLRTEAVTELDDTKPGSWVHVVAPTEAEIEQLIKKFKLAPGHLHDALDEDEVPRLEREDDQTYIYVRYASRNPDGDMATAPLLIILVNELVITVSQDRLPAADALLKGRIPFATTQRTKLILLILTHISEQYDSSISQTGRKVKAIRSRLRTQGITNEDFIDFATIEDELSEFLSSLQPTNAALRRLLAGRQLQLFEADQDIVEDLLLSNEQSIEASKANIRSIANIREAYAAINANNLNRTLTILTIATLVISVPGFAIGVYSMNIKLPYQHTGWIFPVIMAFNAALMVGVIWIARRRRII